MAKANTKDALFSEHAVYAAQSRWEKHDIIPDTKIPRCRYRSNYRKIRRIRHPMVKAPRRRLDNPRLERHGKTANALA